MPKDRNYVPIGGTNLDAMRKNIKKKLDAVSAQDQILNHFIRGGTNHATPEFTDAERALLESRGTITGTVTATGPLTVAYRDPVTGDPTTGTPAAYASDDLVVGDTVCMQHVHSSVSGLTVTGKVPGPAGVDPNFAAAIDGVTGNAGNLDEAGFSCLDADDLLGFGAGSLVTVGAITADSMSGPARYISQGVWVYPVAGGSPVRIAEDQFPDTGDNHTYNQAVRVDYWDGALWVTARFLDVVRVNRKVYRLYRYDPGTLTWVPWVDGNVRPYFLTGAIAVLSPEQSIADLSVASYMQYVVAGSHAVVRDTTYHPFGNGNVTEYKGFYADDYLCAFGYAVTSDLGNTTFPFLLITTSSSSSSIYVNPDTPNGPYYNYYNDFYEQWFIEYFFFYTKFGELYGYTPPVDTTPAEGVSVPSDFWVAYRRALEEGMTSGDGEGRFYGVYQQELYVFDTVASQYLTFGQIINPLTPPKRRSRLYTDVDDQVYLFGSTYAYLLGIEAPVEVPAIWRLQPYTAFNTPYTGPLSPSHPNPEGAYDRYVLDLVWAGFDPPYLTSESWATNPHKFSPEDSETQFRVCTFGGYELIPDGMENYKQYSLKLFELEALPPLDPVTQAIALGTLT